VPVCRHVPGAPDRPGGGRRHRRCRPCGGRAAKRSAHPDRCARYDRRNRASRTCRLCGRPARGVRTGPHNRSSPALRMCALRVGPARTKDALSGTTDDRHPGDGLRRCAPGGPNRVARRVRRDPLRTSGARFHCGRAIRRVRDAQAALRVGWHQQSGRGGAKTDAWPRPRRGHRCTAVLHRPRGARAPAGRYDLARCQNGAARVRHRCARCLHDGVVDPHGREHRRKNRVRVRHARCLRVGVRRQRLRGAAGDLPANAARCARQKYVRALRCPRRVQADRRRRREHRPSACVCRPPLERWCRKTALLRQQGLPGRHDVRRRFQRPCGRRLPAWMSAWGRQASTCCVRRRCRSERGRDRQWPAAGAWLSV